MDKVKVYKIKSLRNNYFLLTSDIFIVVFSTPPMLFIIVSSLDIHIKIFLCSAIVALFYFLIKQNYKGRPTYLYILDLFKYLFKNKKYIFSYNVLEIDARSENHSQIGVKYLHFLKRKTNFK
jgi:hypothetical protein